MLKVMKCKLFAYARITLIEDESLIFLTIMHNLVPLGTSMQLASKIELNSNLLLLCASCTLIRYLDIKEGEGNSVGCILISIEKSMAEETRRGRSFFLKHPLNYIVIL